ncbi:asparagine synthase (glutamine-hydrolyzing) [Kribbella sp. NBC_01505]|uniref:asparagine synthase (glutamine-hydrolyzing) n=1 Tax=Kribbella sp. NBC_01505 TaxID=2903580 RepID=UPI003868FDDD
MCGIFAVWSPQAGLTSGDVDAIGVLGHRGPDAVTRWVSPCAVVALAHTRLAIVGIGNGDQPVRNHSGDVRAVVNGEFYGYRCQRSSLAARGHAFSTDSDSEIAVHLYEEDPAGFVEQLRGEFAFVLWDDARECLLAVRDRFGVKPLYYTWIAGRLVLASEVKALWAAGARRTWDAESFYDYLHACFAPDRTLFDGVYQVPPGALLRADRSGVRIEQYWDLDYPSADRVDHEVSPTALSEQVREQVEESVRLRLVADVALGSHLSGGVDSSSVAGVAAAQIPLRTFTIRFPGSALDEGEVARRTAVALGTEHHEVVVDAARYSASVTDTIVAGEMVQENGHGTARLAQSAAIQGAGLRVALAGEGGDELFGGYQHLQADLRLGESAGRVWPDRPSYRTLLAGPVPATLTGTLDRLGFLPGWLIDRCLTTTLPVLTLLRPEFVDRFAERNSLAELTDRADAQLRGRSPAHQSLYLFFKTWFCNYILAAERLDMAHAIEVRLPLLDHRLFESVRHLPLAELRRGQVKQILRDSMRGYLTDEVYRGPKRGLFAPPAVDARSAARLLRRRLATGAVECGPFFEPVAVLRFLHQLENGRRPVTPVEDRMLHLVRGFSILHSSYELGT